MEHESLNNQVNANSDLGAVMHWHGLLTNNLN